MSLADTPALPALAATLSDAERRRAERFRRPRDRDRFVAGRGSLRHLLGRYLGRAPAEVPLTARAYGKPALEDSPGAPDLRFNLSHAGDLALIAVTLGREIGIDLERLRPVPEATHIAAAYFTPADSAALAATPASGRDAAFLRVWTAREALGKGLGLGLVGAVDQPGPRGAAPDWEVREINPDPGYVAALAIAGGCRLVWERDWPGPVVPADASGG